MNAYCHGPMTCSISETVHIGRKWKLKAPTNFNIGVLKSGVCIVASREIVADRFKSTGGYNGDTAGLTKSQSRKINLEEGQCGYFTFLPIDKEVW